MVELCKSNQTRSFEICCHFTFEALPFESLVKFEYAPDKSGQADFSTSLNGWQMPIVSGHKDEKSFRRYVQLAEGYKSQVIKKAFSKENIRKILQL